MVGKSYLRYVVGPQGGCVASSASLQMDAALVQPSVVTDRAHRPQGPAQATAAACLFVPSLEAVRVYYVRSGALLHTLIPAEAKMPLEVTTLHVVPLVSTPPAAAGGPQRSEQSGWLLLVGYANGFMAVFSGSPHHNGGKPSCLLYALGHKVDTAVLCAAVDAQRTTACSAGQDTDITVWDLVSREAVCRLRGHRGGVVGVEFVQQKENLVISAAADGLVKVWDVHLRQCVQTLVASDAQVTAIKMDSTGSRLYCGMRENYIKVFSTEALARGAASDVARLPADTASGGGEDDAVVADHGTVARRYHKPITHFSFSADGGLLLACTRKTLEVYRVSTAEDVKRKVLRKRKRRRAAAEEEAAGVGATPVPEAGDAEADGDNDNANTSTAAVATSTATEPTAAEEVVLLRSFFLADNIRSACFIPPPNPRDRDHVHIAVLYSNNLVQTFTTALTTSDVAGAATWSLEDLKLRHSYEHQGHQSDIRHLAFVENDTVLLSLSREKVMMWAVAVKSDLLESDHADPHDFYEAKEANLARVNFKGSLNSVGSLALEEATAMAALSPHVCCIGQHDGTVLLADVAASEVVFSEPAVHIGGVKDITRRPDASGFLSIGVDRRLLLWAVGLTQGQQQPTLLQVQEVELTELPLFAAFSPDERFLGVGLQNNHIQLFFADTLKPYLSLFGHKLPPTSLSFSSDGTLVASGGMDKSLRFWGTDFGDCHRAIHAHDEYITQVTFVPGTHYVFTASMDGSVKQWDGDNWTMIQLMRQHQRGVWSVAVTINGTCVASAGVDKCIRCFLRTQDIVFPQEEEERMAQEAMDEETAKRAAMQRLESNDMEVGVAGQQTAATAEAAERLMEALDLVSVELQRQQNPEDATPRHPLLANCTEYEYLWAVIDAIRPSELRHALLALTSVHADALLSALVTMLERKAVLNYETAAKIVLALVMPAPGQSMLNSGLRSVAISSDVSEVHGARRLGLLRRLVAGGLDHAVGRMDYNIAGLQHVRQYLEDTEKTKFYDLSKIQGYKKKYNSRALPDRQK